MGHFSALYSIICQKTDFTGLYGEWETGKRLFAHNIEIGTTFVYIIIGFSKKKNVTGGGNFISSCEEGTAARHSASSSF